MACDNISLPSSLDSTGQPFLKARLIDVDCGCGTTVPSASNCVASSDIDLVDPIPVLDPEVGGFVSGNGIQMGAEQQVATINSLQCCSGNLSATEAILPGTTVDTVLFADDSNQTQVVVRWRRGSGTDSPNIYARLVFLDALPFDVVGGLPYDIAASADGLFLYLCANLVPAFSARVQVGNATITVS